ncbi:hypothetical protein [Noviherbaspirillum sedimenti]|uniref:Uncharacterized protein n=1 Tax=Noviherbaspirillum sedimenti TaxID=2320865 RepID=A0A3A3G558_9BURK|nr:hypothetical protein [Noviherbaspirillum sedimenti]RJG03071.1 hypothetical protein D3878_17040 [Noviherbaspirillum sedimenti]
MVRTEYEAYKLEILVEAACRYALVMDLLSLIHDMRTGQQMSLAESELMNTASVAALLARAERLSQGIDRE